MPLGKTKPYLLLCHAAVYARITYITAWLKHYYPTEFMATAMDYANKKQLIALVAECKRMNIKIHPADINLSSVKFLPKADGSIYFGLGSINGIVNLDKMFEERAKCPFLNFADYMLRGHIKKNITENLIDVGAFDCFNTNRRSVHEMFNSMMPYLDKKNDLLKAIEYNQTFISIIEECEISTKGIDVNVADEILMDKLREAKYTNKTIPTKSGLLSKIDTLKNSLSEIKEDIEMAEKDIPFEITDEQAQLSKEKELTGVYISGHPLNQYKPKGVKVSELPAMERKVVTIQGIITDVLELHKRSDGTPFAKVELETRDDTVNVMFFPKAYEQHSQLLKKDSVVIITGKVMEEKRLNQEENEEETVEEKVYQIFASDIRLDECIKPQIMIHVENMFTWMTLLTGEFFDSITTTKENGYQMIVHLKMFNELRTANFYVTRDIVDTTLYGFLQPHFVTK